MNEVLEELKRELPPILYRGHPRFKELVGLSPRTLANLDSQGKGPRRKVTNGSRVGYPKQDLIAWIRDRLEVELGGGGGR